jgi:hypothetical protein
MLERASAPSERTRHFVTFNCKKINTVCWLRRQRITVQYSTVQYSTEIHKVIHRPQGSPGIQFCWLRRQRSTVQYSTVQYSTVQRFWKSNKNYNCQTRHNNEPRAKHHETWLGKLSTEKSSTSATTCLKNKDTSYIIYIYIWCMMYSYIYIYIYIYA